MHINELKDYYPPGRQAKEPIEILNIKPANTDNAWVGHALMPDTAKPKKVIIHALTLEDDEIEYRVIPAACPHQGYDLSYDPLKSDGNVYCTLHRRPICIYSEYNQAYRVKVESDRYFIQ